MLSADKQAGQVIILWQPTVEPGNLFHVESYCQNNYTEKTLNINHPFVWLNCEIDTDLK